jgi:TonB family protein
VVLLKRVTRRQGPVAALARSRIVFERPPENAVYNKQRVLEAPNYMGERLALVLFVFALAVPCNSQNGKKKLEYPPECVPRIQDKILPLKGPFKILPKETFKAAPSVRFDILQDGSVANMKLVRSSGISDIDSKLLSSVAHSKYKPRPPGCDVIESVMTVIIDWRD